MSAVMTHVVFCTYIPFPPYSFFLGGGTEHTSTFLDAARELLALGLSCSGGEPYSIPRILRLGATLRQVKSMGNIAILKVMFGISSAVLWWHGYSFISTHLKIS